MIPGYTTVLRACISANYMLHAISDAMSCPDPLSPGRALLRWCVTILYAMPGRALLRWCVGGVHDATSETASQTSLPVRC